VTTQWPALVDGSWQVVVPSHEFALLVTFPRTLRRKSRKDCTVVVSSIENP
jgi:hypothetical protein